MRILYANHTSRVSGAERSLLDLLAALPTEVEAMVVGPPGELADSVRRLGVPFGRITGTDGSLKIHPWRSTRAVVDIWRAALELRTEARRMGADLIHANSIRAGLVASLTAHLGGPPVIVHVRDCLPPSRAARLTRYLIGHGASMVIANSQHTATNFAQGRFNTPMLPSYDRVDLSRFRPGDMTQAEARDRLGLYDAAAPVLGIVGQLTPWKAQDDAIRCLACIRRTQPTAQLLIVGRAVFTSKATRYDNSSYVVRLNQLVSDLKLGGSVQFLGEREDIPQILRALDVLLVPSWEEPFGRMVVEGMAMETPVMATNVGGPAELITDGIDGILLPPRQPERWAAAIGELVRRPARLREIGQRGRVSAMRFGRDSHIATVLEAYRSVLDMGAN